MTRNLGILSVVLTAVLALAGTAVSQAMAAEEFHCEGSTSGTCVGTGTTENTETEGVHEEFSTTGEPIVIKCHGQFETTHPANAATITVTPHYSSCTNGETITTNHCAYIMNAATNANGDAAVSLECETGSALTISIPGICTLSFGPQTVGGGVHYTNLANGTVTVQATVTGITYTKSNGGGQAFCALISGTGLYRAKGIVTCYEDLGSALTGTAKTTPTGLTSEGSTKTCKKA